MNDVNIFKSNVTSSQYSPLKRLNYLLRIETILIGHQDGSVDQGSCSQT